MAYSPLRHRSRDRCTSLAVISLSLLGLPGLRLKTRQIVRRAEFRSSPLGEFVTVDDVLIQAHDRGTGPPMVLIYGDGGSVYGFTFSIFDRMSRQSRTIVLDRPGLGCSERPAHGDDPLVQPERLPAAFELLGVDQPVSVIPRRDRCPGLRFALP